jgi:hypothetical protein
MAATSSEAEKIVDGILYSNDKILAVSIIDKKIALPLNLDSLLKMHLDGLRMVLDMGQLLLLQP